MTAISILIDPKRRHVGKTYSGGRSQGYRGERYWGYERADLHSIRDLSELMIRLEDRGDSCVIRGTLTEAGEVAVATRGEVRRSKRDLDGRAAHFIDFAQDWICVDCDNFRMDPKESPLDAIERYISDLPPEFHQASYHYQFSSSFMVKDQSTLKVHLWFWFETPITSAKLKAYFKSEIASGRLNEGYVDLAPINEVQQLFISRPRFIDRHDPLINRSGLVTKAAMSVGLPERAYEDIKVTKRKRGGLRSPSQAPISLPPSRAEIYYADKGARTFFEKPLNRYLNASTGRNSLIFRAACAGGQLISAGRVNESGVISEIVNASIITGCYMRRGEAYIIESIQNGLNLGKQNPKEDKFGGDKLPEIQARSDVEEINAVTRSLMQTAIDHARSDKLDILRIPTGAGKTRVALDQLGALNLKGRTAFFLSRDHQQLAEARERLRELHPSIDSQIWESKQRRCSEYQAAKGQPLQEVYDEIIEEASFPLFCQEVSCPKYKTSKCDTWRREERESEGRFTFSVHAMLPHLKDLPDDSLLVVDEDPQLTYTSSMPLSLLDGLTLRPSDRTADALDYDAQFRHEHRDTISALAPILVERITERFKQVSVGRYGEITALDRADFIGEGAQLDQALIDLATKVLSIIKKEKPLPRRIKFKDRIQVMGAGALNQEDAEAHRAQEESFKKLREELMPGDLSNDEDSEPPKVTAHLTAQSSMRAERKGITLVKHLARLIVGEPVSLSAKIAGNGRERRIDIERRSLLEWPRAQSIVLDATADSNQWRAYAERSGLTHEVHDVPLSGGISRGHRITTGRFQRSALEFDDSGCFTAETMTSIGNALKTVRRRLDTPQKIALITSKPIHSFLSGVRDGRVDIKGHDLAEDLADLFNAGHELNLGYVGRDHIATNRFEDCTALIILGAQYLNLGDVRADIDFLTADLGFTDEEKDNLYQAKADAIHIQAIGRLRGLRRDEDLTFFYFAPRKARSPSVPNLIWTKTAGEGRPKTKKIERAEEEAEEALERGEEISVPIIKSRWGVGKNTAYRIFIELIERHPEKVMLHDGGDCRPVRVLVSKKPIDDGGLDLIPHNHVEDTVIPPTEPLPQFPYYIYIYKRLGGLRSKPPLINNFYLQKASIHRGGDLNDLDLSLSPPQAPGQTASALRSRGHYIHPEGDPDLSTAGEIHV